MSDDNDANNKVVAKAEGLTSDAFHRLLDLAITGRGKLQGARTIANNQLRQRHDHEDAIRWLANQHIALASGQGFATNWGGFLLSLVTIPANMAAAAFIQARAVAAIAHLRGYELDDPRVRTAILMVMLGPRGTAALIAAGDLPSSAAAVATAPAFDPHLDSRVSRALLEQSMNHVGGKRLGVFLSKRIPLVGGGVGAVVDGWSTRSIIQHAQEQFRSRRPRTTGYVIIVED